MPHQNPTATQQSYWELGSQDAPLFARLLFPSVSNFGLLKITFVNTQKTNNKKNGKGVDQTCKLWCIL